ncbi:MAG: ferredoxin [Caulobacteraceae bacterium]|nr:MAG: ferredoxin [Caulobacteraceae bacterium]
MSPTDTVPPAGFRITGWHVLIGVTLFFAIVIAVDVLFMVKAYQTFSGQIVKNPYEAGLAWNQHLLDEKHQVALGWSVDAGLQGDGGLVVTVNDRTGAPVEGLKANATLERPATEQGRVMVRLDERAPGVYEGRPVLAPGAWDLSAVLEGPAGPFQAERRIIAP